MADLFGLKTVECPYLPPHFVAMQDARGIVVCNTKTGHVFRIPPIKFDLKMPEEFRVEGDRLIGDMRVKWSFQNA